MVFSLKKLHKATRKGYQCKHFAVSNPSQSSCTAVKTFRNSTHMRIPMLHTPSAARPVLCVEFWVFSYGFKLLFQPKRYTATRWKYIPKSSLYEYYFRSAHPKRGEWKAAKMTVLVFHQWITPHLSHLGLIDSVRGNWLFPAYRVCQMFKLCWRQCTNCLFFCCRLIFRVEFIMDKWTLQQRALIMELYFRNGCRVMSAQREFPRATTDKSKRWWVTAFRQTGSVADAKRSGWPWSVRTAANIAAPRKTSCTPQRSSLN